MGMQTYSTVIVMWFTHCVVRLKATLAEGGEANKLISSGQAAVPKAREDKSRIDNCNQTNSGLLGDRNSLEAADGSSNKHSDDEKPAVGYLGFGATVQIIDLLF